MTNMKVGFQFKPVNIKEITHTQLVRYAGASGDFNQIHTVAPYAEEAGLGGVIAHGMLVMGFLGKAIGDWISVKDLKKIYCQFKGMTRPGEKLVVKGSIVGETEDRWLCEAQVVNEVDDLKAKSTFELKK